MHRHLATVLLLAASAVPLAAQAAIAHANFDDFVFLDNNSMGGPNLWLAIRTQIPAATVATRLEVWTGERTGSNTLSLWSHDAVNNRPLAQLGGGSWQMTKVNGWQGAPLAAPVPLAAGQDVWLVWACVNGAQSSTRGTGAGAQPYRGSFNGGATWNGPFQSLQWKFRIWTGPAGHYEAYGAGCNGSAGRPELGWFGMPMAGGSFSVHLDRAVPGNAAILTFGDSDTFEGSTPLPYSLAAFGAPACSVLGSLLVTLISPTDPVTGQAVVTVSLPPSPALAGFRFYDQWFCLDLAANPLGLTTSNGGAATVGL